MNTALRFTLLLLVMFAAATLVWANSSNPPIGVTGAPGEPTCAQAGCHDQFPLNSGPGEAKVGNGLSWTFPIGTCSDDTLSIPMMVTHAGSDRWGFELTVVDETGARSGSLYLVDPGRTRIVDDVRSYVFHTEAGTDAGTPDSSPGWEVNWVYESVFPFHPMKAYLVGVAADNDGTPQGDYVYTDSAEIQIYVEDPICPVPGDFNLSGSMTSADLISLVNYIFKSGPPPPAGKIYADWNCDGTVTAADVIGGILYVFKGGWSPCDVCSSCCPIDADTWSCP